MSVIEYFALGKMSNPFAVANPFVEDYAMWCVTNIHDSQTDENRLESKSHSRFSCFGHTIQAVWLATFFSYFFVFHFMASCI